MGFQSLTMIFEKLIQNTMALFRSPSDRKQIGMFDKNAPYLKALQEGYGVAAMYTSARNTFNRYNSTVSFAYENYWPVQIRHYSPGGVLRYISDRVVRMRRNC